MRCRPRADERPSKDRERPTKDREKIDRGPDGPRRPFEDRLETEETAWWSGGGPTRTKRCKCNGTCSFDGVRDARDVSVGLADEIPILKCGLGIVVEMLSCSMGHVGKGECT